MWSEITLQIMTLKLPIVFEATEEKSEEDFRPQNYIKNTD